MTKLTWEQLKKLVKMIAEDRSMTEIYKEIYGVELSNRISVDDVEKMKINVNVVVRKMRGRISLRGAVEAAVGVARDGEMIYVACHWTWPEDLIRRMEARLLGRKYDPILDEVDLVKTAYTDEFSATWRGEGYIGEIVAFVAVTTAIARLFKKERVRARLCGFDWDGPAYKVIGLPAYVFIDEDGGDVYALVGKEAKEAFKTICKGEGEECDELLNALHVVASAVGGDKPTLDVLYLAALAIWGYNIRL